MRCTIPEISWHNRDPVLSVDIGSTIPKSDCDGTAAYRLATGGTDSHVLIWRIQLMENGAVHVEIVADLVRHNRAVNVVRFNKVGDILASGDDEANILLWRQQDISNAPDIFSENVVENKENWVVLRALRGHMEDVYDLAWSYDSNHLISGSVDNTTIIWDVQTGRNLGILADQKGFVQGVTVDPSSQLIATMSSDRVLRVYDMVTKKVISRVSKVTLPFNDCKCDSGSVNKDDPCAVHMHAIKLFHDDTFKSFFRRLSFSPDGELLVVPSGVIEHNSIFYTNASFLFSRSNLSKPAIYFPTGKKFTLAVRFCPLLFELNPLYSPAVEENCEQISEEWKKYSNMCHLPYRMVFAVAVQDSVLLYDTQQPVPFAEISNIHYTRLSDLSWSPDGRVLMVSSTDGYCSFVSFGQGELGIPFKGKEDKTEGSPVENNIAKSSHNAEANPPEGKKVSLITARSSKNEGRKIEIITLHGTENSNIILMDLESNPTQSHSHNDNDSASFVPVDSDCPKTLGEEEIVKGPTLFLEEESLQEASPIQSSKPLSTILQPAILPSVEEGCLKTPRRVSLITLSSPKSRKPT